MSDPQEVRTLLEEDGTITTRFVHWECAARMVVGSVGHQMGRCSCNGGDAGDPEGMTKRQAAQAALALARTRHQWTDPKESKA